MAAATGPVTEAEADDAAANPPPADLWYDEERGTVVSKHDKLLSGRRNAWRLERDADVVLGSEVRLAGLSGSVTNALKGALKEQLRRDEARAAYGGKGGHARQAKGKRGKGQAQTTRQGLCSRVAGALKRCPSRRRWCQM